MAGGIVCGLLAPGVARSLEVISAIFLRLIKSVIAPVLFGVLIRAIAGSRDSKQLGRVGWRALVYFEISTTIALLLGWFVVVVVHPGAGISLPITTPVPAAERPKVGALIEGTVPASIIDAMARGDVLQIVVFCFLFGSACAAVGEKGKAVFRFADSIADIAFRYTKYVMYAAPPAVFAAMAVTVAESGGSALQGLAKFVAAAWAAQLIFLFVVIGGSLLVARVPIRRFIHYAREPFLVAFATTSSAAALPQTLENMELFGVPKQVLGIVAPLSLSLNLAGSTIHLAMATLFVAQAAGMALPLDEQILILLTLKLTSKGVAGIPRANFVILAGLFAAFGLPLQGLTMLLGVDAIIDMIRTSVNVVGHCAAGPIIARWESSDTADNHHLA